MKNEKPSQNIIEAGQRSGFTEEEVIIFEEMMRIERKAFLKGLSISLIVLVVLIVIQLFL